MDHHLSSHVHAADDTAASGNATGGEAAAVVVLDVETTRADPVGGGSVDYMARAQWLRAAVLGANDGLVSVASLMIGVGA
ncbi:hypothetical protein EJB05_56678, partial [Eragrostis curvula]